MCAGGCAGDGAVAMSSGAAARLGRTLCINPACEDADTGSTDGKRSRLLHATGCRIAAGVGALTVRRGNDRIRIAKQTGITVDIGVANGSDAVWIRSGRGGPSAAGKRRHHARKEQRHGTTALLANGVRHVCTIVPSTASVARKATGVTPPMRRPGSARPRDWVDGHAPRRGRRSLRRRVPASGSRARALGRGASASESAFRALVHVRAQTWIDARRG